MYETSEHFLQRQCDERRGLQLRIQNAIGVHDDPLTMVKKRKLRWYGHISRSSGMAEFCRGQRKEQEGKEDRRRDDESIKEWSLEIPCGQQKTGKCGTVLLQRHLWCPDDLRVKGLRWDECQVGY